MSKRTVYQPCPEHPAHHRQLQEDCHWVCQRYGQIIQLALKVLMTIKKTWKAPPTLLQQLQHTKQVMYALYFELLLWVLSELWECGRGMFAVRILYLITKKIPANSDISGNELGKLFSVINFPSSTLTFQTKMKSVSLPPPTFRMETEVQNRLILFVHYVLFRVTNHKFFTSFRSEIGVLWLVGLMYFKEYDARLKHNNFNFTRLCHGGQTREMNPPYSRRWSGTKFIAQNQHEIFDDLFSSWDFITEGGVEGALCKKYIVR